MKVIHLIGGGDVGGAKSHVLSLVAELGKHIDVALISLRPGPFADDAKAMGIDTRVVAHRTIWSDLREIKQMIDADGFYVLHCHGSKANMYGMFLKNSAGVVSVTTVHSDYRLDYLQSWARRLSFGLINKVALRFIDFYIAVSSNFRSMLVGRNFPADRIFTLYNGIRFETEKQWMTREAFSAKYGVDLRPEHLVVGILGRMDPVKGMATFVRACAGVAKKHPNARFILGGEGKEKAMLEELASSLGVRSQVLFPGWIQHPHDFMSVIDINTLTSLSESFPYVILEGTLFERPTVSSDVGGISDLIHNGVNGFLFQPGDHKALSESLDLLLSNAGLREGMGKKLHEKARSEFSLENMCATQLDIYKRMTSSY